MALVLIFILLLGLALFTSVRVLDKEQEKYWSVKKRLGMIYEGLNVSRPAKSLSSAQFIVMSMFRRVLLGPIITFGIGNPLVQYYYIHFSCTLMLAFVALVRPHKALNR